MKKVLISLFLLISTLMLSSCQVNWFGSHFDVPWYFIAVPVFVLFIVLYVIIVSKTYVCPKCKTEFKPKWYQIYITIHFNDSRIAKCPNCGRKGFCKRKDQWHLFCQHDSKNPESDARRSEGQFCKNTVYFVRDMPYSCFLGLTRFYGFLPSIQAIPFHRECQSVRRR